MCVLLRRNKACYFRSNSTPKQVAFFHVRLVFREDRRFFSPIKGKMTSEQRMSATKHMIQA